MNKDVKIKYNKLENIAFNKKKYIDLRETKICDTNDLVNVCNMYKDPRFETFRILYMKNNKIVGQEAITNKIPNSVSVFKRKPRLIDERIRLFENMRGKIKRLNADGYYLAHNHPSGSAEASESDVKITRMIALSVRGFLGHIIIGDSNRYSIIEKNKDGMILMPKEQTLNEVTIKNLENKLKDTNPYDIKIKSREELVALLEKIQNEKEYSVAVLTDSKCKVRMILDIPNRMFNQDLKNLNGYFKNIARNCGSIRIFIGTQDEETYKKILKHRRYGTIKDFIYFDYKNNELVTEKIEKTEKTPDLFDTEKSRKNIYMR